MAIIAQDIIDATSIYVPASNQIPDSSMLTLAQDLIDKYGDDDSNLNLICCEFLKVVGAINGALSTVDLSGKKREKLGDHEIEYFEGDSGNSWDDFVDKVNDTICPLVFGINKPYVTGATIGYTPETPIIRSTYKING